jgi:hypothetical protein
MTDEIQRSLGRIEGKLDQFLARYDDDIPSLQESARDYHNFKGRALGAIATISAILGAFGTQIAAWIKGA